MVMRVGSRDWKQRLEIEEVKTRIRKEETWDQDESSKQKDNFKGLGTRGQDEGHDCNDNL